MTNLRDHLPLDALASELAGREGEAWKAMADFPGYSRAVWRDRARSHVLANIPGAVVECAPPGWDGRDGICFIRYP